MTDLTPDPGQAALELDDRRMLDQIKAGVLGKKSPVHRIGRFRVLHRLGQGAMGVVHAGMDDQLRRGVALKLLHRGVGASEDERKVRLLREAQVLARLEHPNIVQVHEVGEHDGQLYMAMELVDGRPLDDFQRRREWKALLPLYVAAGRGLAAAHAEGVVHRDFKPQNVLVDQKGEVRVVDFGLARENVGDEPLTAEAPEPHEGAIERPRVEHLTATGVVPGTPAYMAPELFEGRPASPASDQFSFCVALYEAVYGRRPFAGSCLSDVISAAKDGQILPPPAERSVPRWLFEVLVRGLAARPEARHPSMEALLVELERDRARRWKQMGVGTAAVVMIAATMWAGGQSNAAFDAWVLPDRTAETERRSECRARTGELEARWQGAKQGLPRPPAAGADADGLEKLLDADAVRLFQRWEGSCLADVTGTLESCRAQAELAFGTVTSEPRRGSLHEDSFHAITYDLELCLEGGFAGECGGPVRGSPAVVALDEALAAELVGDVDEALAHADRSIELAGAGDELTRLRALLRKGAIHERRREIEEARSALDGALFGALVCDADVLAFDAVIERAEAEILHFGKLEPARESLERAGTLLDAPGMSALPLRRARLLERRGTAELYLEHDCIDALPLLQQALELRNEVIAERSKQGLPTAHIERLAADAELNLANVGYYALSEGSERCPHDGRSEADLVAAYRAARARFAATVDDVGHLGLVEYEFSLGALLLQIGDFAGAIASFESALAIFLAHHEPDSLPVGVAHRALAGAYGMSGELARAQQHAEAVVAIQLAHAGESGQQLALAQAHDALGLILLARDMHEGARDAVTRAIAVLADRPRERLELNELEQLYMSELNLALIEHVRGEPTAVRHAAGEARATQRAIEARTGEPHRGLALHQVVEAWILLDDGEPREALARLVEAEAIGGFDATLTQHVAEARQRADSVLSPRSSPQPESREP